MSKRSGFLAACAVVSVVLSFRGVAEEPKAPASSRAASSGKVVLIPGGEMKWVVPPDAPPGVQVAVLRGDPARGSFAAMHRFVAGFEEPLHSHSSNYRGVVVSGTLLQTVEGERDRSLTAGSYFSYPGKTKHRSRCAAGAECVVFVECDGAWDVLPADRGTSAPAK